MDVDGLQSRAWRGGPRRWIGRLMPRPAVQHVSVGSFCLGAAVLRRAGLRRWSGPFDWIFSTPGMAAVCIEDDFATFLDPAELVSVPARELGPHATRQCRHPAYEARFGVPILFNHHDPLGSARDRHYMERAVTRLRRALDREDGSNVLYLMSECLWPESELAALEAAIIRRPSRNLLANITFSTAARRGLDICGEDRAGRFHRLDVRVDTLTRTDGVRFRDDPDDDAHVERSIRTIAEQAG